MLNLSGQTIEDLSEAVRWVAWRTETRGNGKPTKVPLNPKYETRADTTDPQTWGTLEDALSADDGAQVGIVLGDWLQDAIGGVDLDSCRDPNTARIEPWAQRVIDLFRTYAEVSPSGRGVKLFFRFEPSAVTELRETGHFDKKQFGRRFEFGTGPHPAAVECYLGRRYFAVTFDGVPDTPDTLRLISTDTLRQLFGDIGPSLKSKPDDDEWPEPLNLFGANVSAPELSQGHVPDALWDFIDDTAMRIGADRSAVALAALVTCSAAISDKWKLQPVRRNTDFTQSARLWGMICDGSGTRKSPIIEACSKPLDKIEMAADVDYQEAMRTYRQEERAFRKSGEKGDEPVKPRKVRYVVENTTVEKLVEILRSDDGAECVAPSGKVLSRHDELSGFFGGLDLYKSGGKGGADRAAYLVAYDGRRYVYDRKNSPSFSTNFSVCILGGVQPGPLRKFAASADEDGLLQRFIFCLPSQSPKPEDLAPMAGVNSGYEDLIISLTALAPQQETVVLDEEAHPHRERIDALVDEIKDSPEASERLKLAISKWTGLFARICLTFHLINSARRGIVRKTVPQSTARRAADYMEFILLPHLLRADEVMSGTSQVSHAKWIAGHILAKGLTRIARRDVAMNYRTLSKAPDKDILINEAMRTLQSYGWIEADRSRKNNQSVTSWIVNPKVHAQFSARALLEKKAREAVVISIKENALDRRRDRE